MPNTNHEQRRDAIRQLLLKGPAKTQDSLVAALTKTGYSATQSSVSRDLREIGAIKTAQGYELPSAHRDDDDQLAAVAELLRTIQPAGPNLLVVRTAIGAAQRVALAFDRCNWPEVIGNIGGDDTVFVATESGTTQKNLITRIEHSTRS
ncbi:MAG: ArgR family transcriptional regulator [Gammaproteobacteria bacterium]|jgi:transcriptional regulator of arginine metabolism|nr:ArgR family transcriptional regulator [Gammaproteobacteria bacterium]